MSNNTYCGAIGIWLVLRPKLMAKLSTMKVYIMSCVEEFIGTRDKPFEKAVKLIGDSKFLIKLYVYYNPEKIGLSVSLKENQ